MNQRSIGTRVRNFQKRQMPTVLKETLMRVIRDRLRLYPTITRIVATASRHGLSRPVFPAVRSQDIDKPEPAQKPEPKSVSFNPMVSRNGTTEQIGG